MKGLAISFAKPSLDWWQRRHAEGYRVAFICLGTGGYAGNAGIKAVAETNLRNARLAGIEVGGYANASPPTWWPLATQVMETRNSAGAEWATLKRVAIDVEIPGITLARVEELADALQAEGKDAGVLYTARWFWRGHMANSQNPRWLRWKLWAAQYDGLETMGNLTMFGPWPDVVGKQYAGTTQLDGHAVDLNTFKEEEMLTQEDKDWIATLINSQGAVRDAQFGKLFGPEALGHLNKRIDELHGKVDGLVLGAGLTEDEVKQAVKDALAEGTG